MKIEDPMKVTGIDQRDPRLCIGHNRAGALCNKYAMKGQNVGTTAGRVHKPWPRLRRLSSWLSFACGTWHHVRLPSLKVLSPVPKVNR